jgi:hypothetical protein
LDRDSSNDTPANLLFLCLAHHDQYDSRPRQSKGLTEQEVRGYAADLRAELERRLAAGVLESPAAPSAPSITVNVTGGAGGAGGKFGGAGGGGGVFGGGGGEGGAGGHQE